MARAAVLGRLNWLEAEVAALAPETPGVRSLVLDVPGWPGHRAGQHVDVRLTAEDGYQAQRSYSIASAPGEERPMITVVEADGGEVSGWMVNVAAEDDSFEVRGPFGGWFVWDPQVTEPVLLIGGGSGMVPLMSMLRAGARGRGNRARRRCERIFRRAARRGLRHRLAGEEHPAAQMERPGLHARRGAAGGPSRRDEAQARRRQCTLSERLRQLAPGLA